MTADERYNRSPKGRARYDRYRQTDKGRANDRRQHVVRNIVRRKALIERLEKEMA